jgi:membrane protease YdiL (CAAX protease family)
MRSPWQSVFREVPWRWSDVLIGLAPLFVARIGFALMGRMDPASLPTAPSWLWIPLTVLAMTWMLVYPLWIARLRHSEPLPRPRARAVFVEGLLALLSLPIVMASMSFAYQAAAYLLGASAKSAAPLEPLARASNRVESLTLFVLAVTVGPVAEEVFFRGLLHNALRQRFRWPVAALLQAFAFGLFHPFDLASSAAIAFVGLALAVLYEWRGTLLAPILLHAMLNAVSLAVLMAGIAADADAPRLGVRGLPQEGGCLVTGVVPGGAADAAGLRSGDLVTTLNGEPVTDIQSMARIIRERRAGDRVTVEFIRGGTAHRIEVVLKSRRESTGIAGP